MTARRGQFSLRALFFAVFASSVAIAIGTFNVTEFHRIRSIPQVHLFSIIGVFKEFQVVWGIAFIAALILAFNVSDKGIKVLSIVFATVAAIGFLVNFLLPIGSL